MTASDFPHDFASNANAAQLRDYLLADTTSVNDGMKTMRWLQKTRPGVASETLCLCYGVACYRVADSCFSQMESAESQDKWFISVPNESALPDAALALSACEADAHQLAVTALDLHALFFGLNFEGTTTGRISSAALAASNVPKCVANGVAVPA